jgi:transcriptional regulator with XRE-family HTH domain
MIRQFRVPEKKSRSSQRSERIRVPRGESSRLVRAIRQARGLTQEQLARELRVTFATVNGWENGRHEPIPALAQRLREMAAAARVPAAGHASVKTQGARWRGKKAAPRWLQKRSHHRDQKPTSWAGRWTR